MLFQGSLKKKAIAYYRHSAEDKQENSVPIQRGHAQKFAHKYDIEIIHEEADEGKTGLKADRPGFENLFNNWILNEKAPEFDYVLVYDVSRWGRFQDQDEAAYYEFCCKQKGKKVVYISRGFPKEEEQLISHLQTSNERYMAAEYSRQLSSKVFHGSVKVSEQGFSAGGSPCYGMARLLLDENKKPVKVLKPGEWKSLSNQRVTLTPKNDETTQTVKDIFSLLVEQWKTPKEIASILNRKGIRTARNKKWDAQKIRRILTNETYTGARIYNKKWSRLRQKTRSNPRSEWVIKHGAFPAIVDSSTFHTAQDRLYWLMPSKWKKGIYMKNKTKQLFWSEIYNVLQHEKLSEDQVDRILRSYPLTLSIASVVRDNFSLCFKISEDVRKSEYVIGVGLSLDEDNQEPKLFFLPTKNFDTSNNFVVTENELEKRGHVIQQEKLQEKIKEILHTRFIKNTPVNQEQT